MTTNAPLTNAPLPAAAEPGHCLAVVSDSEWDLFVPPPVEAALCTQARTFTRVPAVEVEEKGWSAVLKAHHADVLVSCWSTPRLPADLDFADVPLRYLCHLTGGVRGLLPRELLEKGLLVSNWGNSISRTISESALMMILMSLKRAAHWQEELHHGTGWRGGWEGQLSLFSRRVGLHGFGRISQELVGLLKPFGAEIAAYSPSVPDEVFAELGVKRATTLEELFSSNEIIVELAAMTERNRGLVTRELFDLIPDPAVFVNVGRAGVVREEDLLAVAREGRVRMALDVFHREPLPDDDPLRRLTKVALFPHVAGPTEDRMQDSGAQMVANIGRYLAGEKPVAMLSPEAYDRMT